MTTLDIAVVLVYFAGMVGVGLWSMSRVRDQEDYLMGGRRFGKWMQTFAAFGAGTGAHEPVTVGRTGWTSGLSGVWSALMWLFVTPLYWFTAVWYRRMRHLTLGDWFVERYESRTMGAAYAIFTIVFYMFYLSTMLSAIAKFAAPLLQVDALQAETLPWIIIPCVASVVTIYGIAGGLTAAYITDLVQGVFIILLSVMLIPSGLSALADKYGDDASGGWTDGLEILHQRVPPDFFELLGGPAAGEFPIAYVVSLTALVIVGIVVQPHFITTGGGSAKDETEARIGLVVGNFMKRLCTAGWALTALISLALLADNSEIAADPDLVWGVASREILGPLNLGLVGLMLSCLLAAVMSSADTYMIVTSGVVVRNLYVAFIDEDATERRCLLVARMTGLMVVVGASVIALTMGDVFGQFKMAIEIPLVFAAPFWIGMFWRRATTVAAWLTMATTFTVFFVLPYALPALQPSMRADAKWATRTHQVVTTRTRPATAADIAKHDAWLTLRGDVASEDSVALPEEPPSGTVGEPIETRTVTGDRSIFWRDGLELTDEPEWQLIQQVDGPSEAIQWQRQLAPSIGRGPFQLDLLIYQVAGVDLSRCSKATLEALRLPPRLIAPFVLMILLSWMTPRGDGVVLDRYYAKMKTPAHADPDVDARELALSYTSPARFDSRRMFPRTQIEVLKPTRMDVFGFVLCVLACGGIVAGLMWLAGWGAAPR
ncbi:MAG: sodium:solute symporter family protein [Planctomycetota bacterium]